MIRDKPQPQRSPPDHRLDLLPPIPSLPRFERLDLFRFAPLRIEPLFAALASPYPPRPTPEPPIPSPLPPAPPRGTSGNAFSLVRPWSAVAAAERAAVRDGFCIPPAPSWSSWRCDERCDFRDFSCTDLNLSISSVHRIEFSSRVFSRGAAAGRS